MEEIFDKKEAALLIDRYGILLTAKQQEILAAHYYDDLSLSEIAENYGISKSAVSDAVKKALGNLRIYDRKLNYLAKEKKVQELLKAEQISPSVIEKVKEILNYGF